MKSPAFQWYPTDYLGSQRVQMMTLEQEGAYCRLLWYCWQHGSIPSDPVEAAILIGKGASTKLAESVLVMFKRSRRSGRLIHDRLEQERYKQEQWRLKSIKGGKKSAQLRAKGGSTTVARVVGKCLQPNGNSPSSSSSSIKGNPPLQGWQLIKDERELTERIKQEAGSVSPDRELVTALKLQRSSVRDAMKRCAPTPGHKESFA